MSLDVYLLDNWCPDCERGDEVFHCTITHNLSPMATKAKIHTALWRCKDYTLASELCPKLFKAIMFCHKNKVMLEKYNPVNGWGSYESFITNLQKIHSACISYPLARVYVSG
jgi:hypothetical protein